jgi:hypothetical protein
LSQDAISGVGIQSEPCYRSGVSHNKPLVVVNRFNNLADAWRIRICSFTESHNCSIQQVVRFSIYQQATRDGGFRRRSRLHCVTTRQVAMARQASSASRFTSFGPACLSSGRSAT